MHACVPIMCSTHRSQKSSQGPLKLEFHTIVSHHVMLGAKLGSSARATDALSHEVIYPAQ